jgi:tetraacyldisaccharide 4'-kinase
VARDRAAGVRAAAEAEAVAVILDDGFQNPSVAKDLSVVVVDAERGWGNGRAIPAGPLREGVAAGLRRADLVLSLGRPEAQAGFAARWGGTVARLPHLRGELRPLMTGMPWAGCGPSPLRIGSRRILRHAGGLGAEVVGTERSTITSRRPALLRRLRRRRLGAQLVTTEKDAVRLPPRMRATS